MIQAMPGHLRLGRRGEDLAAEFLRRAGMRILERNWRPEKNASLELDIVAQEGDTLIFAEVKSRTLNISSSFTALDNFSAVKRKRLRKAVAMYLFQTQSWRKPCRFDLICVGFPGEGRETEKIRIDHYKNVLAE
ncbi:MAG: YraN family protein [Deltaproteobacteria bacterium]|jgi:putative endonuclease|nr:YraN family protein [Deltaproteobacteria bacterium]